MRIQSYLLQFHRLALLFVPLFLSYPIVFSKAFSDLNITLFGDFDLIRQTNGVWWTVELIVFAVMIPLGIWYFSQISVKNSHKTWVKRVLNKAASSRINKAIRFLYELKNINEKL